MHKTLSKAMALLAVVSLLVFPSQALETAEMPTVKESIEMVLQGMAYEPEAYGLEEVSFDQLTLGTRIPAFTMADETMSEITAIEYYPVLFDSHVIAVARVAYNDNLPMTTISCYLAELVDGAVQHDIPFSLLFDEASEANIIDQDLPLFSQHALLCDERPVSLDVSVPTSLDSLTATQHYLSVPKVQQPTDLSCWAACIKSIGGYYGVSKTINQIYNYGGITPYQGASIMTAWNVFENSPFNFTVQGELAGGTTCIAFSTLKYYIDCGYPLYGAVIYGSNEGHAVVIRGYYSYSSSSSYAGSISYMNPSTASYEASNVASSGSRPYVYTDSYGTYLGDIADFLAVID